MIETIGRIVLAILSLGIVVIIHEWGHLIVARLMGVRVERFTVGFGPELFGWTSRGIRYSVCAIPLGGMVKMAGESLDEQTQNPDEFFAQPWYRRIAIALAGPLMNYVLAFALFAVIAGAWGTFRPSDQPIVGDVVPGLPAAESKLQRGDRIRQIDGEPIVSWEQMARLIHNKPDQALKLRIERATNSAPIQLLEMTLTPKRDPQHGQGLIGIMPQIDKVKPGLRGSLSSGARDVTLWTIQPMKYIGQKLARWEGPRELSGPLGIFQMVSRTTREGLSDVLYLIAIISTGLGLFNLFPIPMLDGGHIFLYLIEGIVRRPLSRRFMQIANTVGLSVIITIFLYASYQDVLRWQSGFWK
ncbi:MAG: M50 family metallopeptidase [Elusimicrobiota bacterium]|jgi:regulator of sigma E protease